MRFISFILLWLCCFSVSGQYNTYDKLDSLKQALRTTQSTDDRLRTLQDIYNMTVPRDIEMANKYLDSVFIIADDSNYNLAYYMGWYGRAYQNFLKREPDSAVINLKKAMIYAKLLEDSRKIAEIHSKLALSYINFKVNVDKGIAHNDSVINLSKIHDLRFQEASAYYANALSYMNQERLDIALTYLIRADSLESDEPLVNSIKGHCATEAAKIFSNLNQFDKSIQYYERAGEYYRISGDKVKDLLSKKSLGKTYLKQGRPQIAFDTLIKVYNFFKQTDDQFQISESAMALSDATIALGNEPEGFKLLNEALEIKLALNDTISVSDTYYRLGRYFQEGNNFENAEDAYLKSIRYAGDSLKLQTRSATYLKLSELYASRGNSNAAYEALQQHLSLKDTIVSRRNSAKLNEIEASYQTQLKENEIAILEAENLRTKTVGENQRKIFILSSVFLLILIVLLVILYYNRNRVNKELTRLNSLKTKLYTDIAHEIRTPLTLIKGPVEKQLSNGDLPESGRKDLNLIKHNTNRMLSMVDQMLDLSKIQTDTFNDKVSEGNLSLLVDELVSLFSFKASEQSIEITKSYSGVENVLFPRETFEKIISNLIENAVKYTPEGGKIAIQAGVNESEFIFSINNSVAETSASLEVEKLFDRHSRFDHSSNGLGIGLSLVRELVDRLEGQISVARENNNEITFNVQLPISNVQEEVSTSELELEQDESVNVKRLLLIVEDNPEIRAFTTDIFQETFDVLSAADGSEGIDIAMERVPDLIISDIMMPKTNGITLCKTLKENTITSHIPIILLTAKVSEENELEGLKVGADSYVRKPFNPEILKQQVVNHLETGEKLRERYSSTLYLEPVETLVDSAEAQFVENLKQVLNDHLSDPQFNAASFAEKLSMSRMQLHRKLKALFGTSTTAFIRSERVKASMSLLENNNLTISEIAYSVGFNTPSYYIKCFKEIHGVTPQEFSNNKA